MKQKRRNLIFVCVWTHYCCGLSAHLCCVVKRTFYATFISICIWTYKKTNSFFHCCWIKLDFFRREFYGVNKTKGKNIKIKIVYVTVAISRDNFCFNFTTDAAFYHINLANFYWYEIFFHSIFISKFWIKNLKTKKLFSRKRTQIIKNPFTV